MTGLDFDAAEVGRICSRYGIASLELFGSQARDEATAASDVDLLYSLTAGAQLGWEIEDLESELSAAFGRHVDLVSREHLHRLLRESVLREARLLYAA